MIYRWLYNIWRFFWSTVWWLLGIALITLALAIGALQLPQTKSFIKSEVISTFENQFYGHLEIEEIRGFIPFRPQVVGGSIFAPGDTTSVFSFETAEVTIGWWELLQQKLAINSFEVEGPSILLSMKDEQLTILSALKQREDTTAASVLEGGEIQLLKRLNIFAPSLTIVNGSITIDSTIELPQQSRITTPFEVQNFNTTAFLEVSEPLIFAEIQNISADLPGTGYEYFRAAGQFYSDNEYFELNRFQLESALGKLDFSIEATPLNLFAGNLPKQFQEADYTFSITESAVKTELVQQFLPGYPSFPSSLEFQLIAEGNAEQMFIDRLQANIGETFLLISAKANNLFQPSARSYEAQLENVVLHPRELAWISDNYLDSVNLERYQLSTVRGEVTGNRNEIENDFRILTEAGSIYLKGLVELTEPLGYDLSLVVDSLDITPFTNDTLNPSVIQGNMTLKGSGTDEDADLTSTLDFSRTTLLGRDFETFIADLHYQSGILNYTIEAAEDEAVAQLAGSFRQTGDHYHVISEGNFQNINITKYYRDFHADTTSFNSTFSVNLNGSGLDDMYGRVSLEMDESIIGQDTLRPHQLYADIDTPDQESRTLRFTSSFFDGEISGSIRPAMLQKMGSHWGGYIRERVSEELQFQADTLQFRAESPFSDDENPVADLAVRMNLKDLSLLKKYLPDFPELVSNARLSVNINASKENLLLTSNLYDESFDSEMVVFENINSSLTANLRYQNKLREFSSVDLQLNSSGTEYAGVDLKESYLNLSLRNGNFQLQKNLQRRSDDLVFASDLSGELFDNRFEFLLNELSLGTSTYKWITDGIPQLAYMNDGALIIDNLIFTSDTDFIEINGTYSTDFEDSVEYSVRNFDLSRVSELIAGRITFSGTMNGDFETRTLTRIPSIQGNIKIGEGRIMDRMIGDVTLSSIFNSDENRFDTDLRIYTDPEKYISYYNRNENIGQDLRFSGYFKIPDETAPGEDLFYFDADLVEVDMWIVTFIAPAIVTEMEGRSSGTGFIRGSRDDYNFESTFYIDDVYTKPLFTDVEYTLNGELDFNRADGLLFRDIELTDKNGGRGFLNGQVDLDDFSPLTILDLTLDLEDLEFMNNPYDREIPFYANLYGSGQVRITGTNLNPFLRTTTPISLASNSRISIPLEEVTQIEQDRRFIQFVDTFDLSLLERRRTERDTENELNDTEDEEFTFVELFTMDLQFTANNPVNVRLVFDRVTGEVINTTGTGQMRILLEDQDVSMFGRFNIQGGYYQFVSGDIFTRRLTLEEGGSISWQGDLVDASLDVTAVYRARPDISVLLPGSASIQQELGQRVPVELVLQIGGTITAIENDFFFRVPTGIEGTLDPTLATQINNLNQNENEKLIQATSILLSGNFIPSSDEQGMGFGEGFSGTAAFVNPLLTSQIINPLLSNQINSLLRSDAAFDIDLNLTAFNEVDLGVALRLFDDRVILRREGQITGEQSDIGDLGATYRINRTFSLTAFHRQDPTLTYTSGSETRQTQEMNGVGLEAQVQFNTWQGFRHRISSAIRSFFGLEKRNQDHDEDDEESVASN